MCDIIRKLKGTSPVAVVAFVTKLTSGDGISGDFSILSMTSLIDGMRKGGISGETREQR